MFCVCFGSVSLPFHLNFFSLFCSSHIPDFIRENQCLFCKVHLLVHIRKSLLWKPISADREKWISRNSQPRVACISAVLNMKQGSYYLCPSIPTYSAAEVICKQCLLITETQLSSPSLRLPYCHPWRPRSSHKWHLIACEASALLSSAVIIGEMDGTGNGELVPPPLPGHCTLAPFPFLTPETNIVKPLLVAPFCFLVIWGFTR